MADVKWIKIVTDIFDDEKIRFIETMPNGDEIIVIWFKILCLCGKSNNGGFLMFTGKLAYTDEMLASIFNRDIKSIQMALKTFESLEMVEMIDNKIYIANWEKHQTLDKLEAKKQYDREYQRKKREERKQLLENRTTVKRLSNDNRVTDIDKEIEEDIELEEKKNIQKKKTRTVFTPPNVDEVKEYCKQMGYKVDAQMFVDFYESKGWMIGKNKMKDWKSAIRTWERKRKEQPKQTTKFNNFEQRAYDMGSLESKLLGVD